MNKRKKPFRMMPGLACLFLSPYLYSASVTVESPNGKLNTLDNVPCCESWSLEQGSSCKDTCEISVSARDFFSENGTNFEVIDEADIDALLNPKTKDDNELEVSKGVKSAKTCKKKVVYGPARCATGLFNTAVAKSRAKNAWKDKVEDLFGSDWNSWSRAEDKDVNWWGPSWSTCATYQARPCAKNSDIAQPAHVGVSPLLLDAPQRHLVDVNGDDLTDIIFVGQNWNGAGLNIRVKMSNGDGTFTHHASVLGDGSGVHTYPSLVGNFNDDDFTDVVFVGQNWSGAGLNIRTKLSNGDGTWESHSQVLGDGAGVHQFPAKVGDFDGDGLDDLLFYFQGVGTGLQVRVKMSNGDGTFTPHSQVLGDGSATTAYPVLVGDMNGDDKDDLILLFQHPNGSGLNVRVKMSNGDGTFSGSSQVLGDGSGVTHYPAYIGDINGDDKDDLIFAFQHWNGSGLNLRVKMSNGDGTFSAFSQVMGDGSGVHTNAALVADFNGDNFVDIAFVGQNWSGSGLNIRVKHSNGNGTFSASSQVMGDGPGVHAHPALLGNIDSNNFADIIFVGQNWSGSGLNIRTKRSNGTGGFVGASDIQGDGSGIHTYPAHSGAYK